MDTKEYKPFLATDKNYLKEISNTINQKEPIEEIKFNLLSDAIKSIGVEDDPYVLLNSENIDYKKIQSIIDKTFELIQEGINENTKEKIMRLWDYLCETDDLQKSDLIFVFGGGGETRPKEAAKLYKEGWAPKVLFTGRSASYMKDIEITEAENFAQIAKKEGVLDSDIIIEKESQNTVENVAKSIELLKKESQLPKRIILIQIEYQMRRAYLTFKGFDSSFEFIRHPAHSAKFKRDDFFTNKDGWSYVFNEFIKIYQARLMKHF